MISPVNILKQYWGYSSFRPLQEDIIRSVLEGRDTLALLPTGGGKSICFQVPAMAMDGICLVISPLIALMKDQVEHLRRKSITAFAIFSGMSRKEVMNTMKLASSSNCKFLYVSPERLETNLFREYLPALNIALVAVDEAHCISQWGYDFRPSYLRIAALREELPGVPVLALTASATPLAQDDICEKLAFKHPAVFRQPFERPNLSYSVFRVDSKINKVLDILQRVPGSSIVYCNSRKHTRQISDMLNMYGIAADFYHAGLTQEERSRRQESWINNGIRTIVCTNAFGMGIDKPDVRVVIHADIPDCPESYYQEAGRAGRDGKKSYAVLLYAEKDLEELRLLPDLRYPSAETIRAVYQALMNFLQVPAGAGEGNYYDFDYTSFIKNFQLNARQAIYAIKALEQEEWISYNEQAFLLSKIVFITGKEHLYEFERNQPQLDPLIKTLLRSYEGIFDLPVNIHEKTIAWIMRAPLEQVMEQLKELHRNRIIEYTPLKDTPQVYFIRNRVKSDELVINMALYEKRKNQFIGRTEAMIKYAQEEKDCHSLMLGHYFGDEGKKRCGSCDNCLRQKPKQLSAYEFDSIHQRILNAVSPNGLPASALQQQLQGIGKEQLWEVIHFLQEEQAIYVSEAGIISPVKK